jgi:predicted amidohydrolase
VATVQFQHPPGDKDYNLGRVRHFVAEATQAGVEIVTFPEMCLTGYWHVRKLDRDAFEALAEPVPAGPCTRELMRLSSENRMTIGAGLLERADDGRIYNSYVVAMPDGSWQVHRKLHVFEHPNISAGDHYTVFDTPHGCRVGVLICYDNNIVENARATALLGAEILLAPHQTGGCNSVSPRGMKPVDPAIWRAARRIRPLPKRSCVDRRVEDGSCVGCRAARTTTVCSCCSAMASAPMMTRFARATRWCSIRTAKSLSRRVRLAMRWS